MGSSRLPGKMGKKIINNKSTLELMIERLKRIKSEHHLLVATTNLEQDNYLEEICKKCNITCFRGHPSDVLDRYYHAALSSNSVDIIVRLTGDCPLHDPDLIDYAIHYFKTQSFDYLSNGFPETFPDGLDVEVMTFSALKKAYLEAKKPMEREHVTPFIRDNKDLFSCGNFQQEEDYSHYRWTLDEAKDLEFITKIYEALYVKDPNFSTRDIIQLLEKKPELLEINKEIPRNEGYNKKDNKYD